MDAMISFGYWVRRRRKALDLTQRALADRVGCSVVTVKKIEAEVRQPSQPLAERFADVLAVPPAERAAFLARARGLLPPHDLSPANEPAFPRMAATLAPLPVEPTPFIGRAAELRQLATLLADPACRLLTLVGPGGIGKTRLMLRAAAQVPVAHGVCFVPLVDLTAPAHVAASIAMGLGLQRTGTHHPEDLLISFLRNHELLLLLDNAEHLLAGDPTTPNVLLDLIARILRACPPVKLLVTSRERLNLQAEWVVPVTGLAVQDDARALFVGRAQRVHPAFTMDTQEPIIDDICRFLEGMPLAIELAASWTPVLECAQIKHQLEQNNDLLATRLRDVPARHRSLRALFDQSWNLLTDDERRLFAALSVFHGGFTSEMMGAVCGAQGETLLALIDKSLVTSDGAGRYRLHALVRRYAAEQLAAAGEEATVQRDYCSAYLTLIEDAAAHFAGSSALRWLSQLDDERDNLRAALEWALVHADAGTLYRLAVPLTRYWYARGQWHEGVAHLDAILARTTGAVVPQRAVCLCWYGFMLIRSGRPEAARAPIAEGYALAQQTEDDTAFGWASLGMSYFVRDGVEPLRYYQAAIEHFRRAADDEARAMALYFLGDELRMRGDTEAARQAYSESWQVYQRLGNQIYGAYPLGNLARLALLDGDVTTARRRFAACVAYSRANGNGISLVDWLLRLGTVALYDGDTAAAHGALHEARALAHRLAYGDSLPTIHCWLAFMHSIDGAHTQALHALRQSVDGYGQDHRPEDAQPAPPLLHHHGPELLDTLLVAAHIAAARGQHNQAVSALGCGATLMNEHGYQVDQPLQALMGALMATCQEAMDPTTYQRYWQHGAAHSGEPLPLLAACIHALTS